MPAVRPFFALMLATMLYTCSCNVDTSDRLTSGTASATQENNSSAIPTRNELNQKFREKRSITFVHGDGPHADRYRELLQTIDIRSRGGNYETKVIRAADLKPEALQNDILFLVGQPNSDDRLQKLMTSLPVTFADDYFSFDGEQFNQPSDVFKLFAYPNPSNQQLPIYCITGNNDEEVCKFLTEKVSTAGGRMFWRSWGYEIYQDSERQVFGHFNSSDWQVDRDQHHDFRQLGDTLVASPHFNFIAQGQGVSIEQAKRLATQCEAAFAAITEFAGKEKQAIKIDYHLFDGIEQKGLKHSNNNIAHSEMEDHKVFVVANDHFKGYQLHVENTILLRKLLGPAKYPALEKGLAVYFTQKWQEKGYGYWAHRLLASDNLPSIRQLLDESFFTETSPLVNHCSAGSLIDFLLKHWGRETFLNRYQSWAPDEKEMAKLDELWRQFIKTQKHALPGKWAKQEPAFYKGFNFAHEGYQIYNGFGSKLARESIERLHDIGANAIAIVPYSYMRNPNQPTRIPVIQSAGSENDAAVLYAHFAAQKMGVRTMLKPQIWLGRSWPGDVEMQSEEDWQAFFEYYYDWILHYAMMAEIYEFDVLCLGVEFAKATVQRPDDWRRIARKIRKLYNGKLTYAANWGEEFEQFSFWDEFDYIGLDCYYPLSDQQEASKKELTKGFQRVLEKAGKISQQYQKPVVFTEIGFRSVEAPWVNPHEDAKNRSFDDQAQNRCYEVVFEAIQDASWLKGMYWWKWPSYLDHTGRNNRGFTPNRKLTEQTVRRWFGTNIE